MRRKRKSLWAWFQPVLMMHPENYKFKRIPNRLVPIDLVDGSLASLSAIGGSKLNFSVSVHVNR
jgi:hypothetical protein